MTMNPYRKQVLFLCDTFMFVCITVFFFLMGTHHTIIIEGAALEDLPLNALVLYVCVLIFQLLFRTYDSLWRYAESREYLSLISAAFFGFSSYEVVNRILPIDTRIPVVLLTSIASIWVLGMLTMRFIYRVYRSHCNYHKGSHLVPVAIVGAGEAGVRLMEEIQSNPNSKYDVKCFFDDNRGKIGKRIRGVKIEGSIQDIPELIKGMDIAKIIVAIPSIPEHRRQSILRELSSLDRIKISVLPNTLELLNDKPIRSQIRDVEIEDLLGRDPIELDVSPVDNFLSGKTVLVTGGGGSIGSELCRQIAKHHPKKLIVLDIYENSAYDIQQELRYKYKGTLDLSVEIATICDIEQLRIVFKKYHPEVVFHAAAHKHVPLMEDSPIEAVRNNVFGTFNLVRVVEEFGVQKFIQISTDKAVTPTNVMGATKRLCEIILQSRKGHSKTTFAAVRFGNVLGSNGSVVPLFKRQIAAGGPVTITDKRIIRYFMTIPEAAQLVLQAGAMAKQNELFVLDMGEPVKILDLAENLIRLSGYIPYDEINIVETGLRPGEKLYEELLVGTRNVEKTENEKIFVEHQPAVTEEELDEKLDILRAVLAKNDPSLIRDAMHQVVPSFHEPEDLNNCQGDDVVIPDQTTADSVHSHQI